MMTAARCPWYVAGPLLGLLIVALRAAVNKPLGALGGYIDLLDGTTRARRLGFSGYLLIGIVLGGALFATLTGRYAVTWAYPGALLPAPGVSQFVVLGLAGLVMGVGARTAGGCTSGHGLTGVALGSPASLVAMMTFFATAVALANVITWLVGGLS
jgi:uncharacterized membrane protein YedE/YeeE